MAKKKGKKGKSKKTKAGGGGGIVTTKYIVREREKCLCPRLGDSFLRELIDEEIQQDSIWDRIAAVNRNHNHNSHGGSLDLSQCWLPSIPSQLLEYHPSQQQQPKQQQPPIIQLDLSKNDLFHMGTVFDNLSKLAPQLQTLNLSHNHLTGRIPETAGDLCQLEELILDSNHITHLPQSCNRWIHLRLFSCKSNELVELPEEVDWINIEVCDLTNNPLRQLPMLNNWKQLKKLYVSRNSISNIPSCIGESIHLSELDMSHNHITSLPLELQNNVELRYVNMGNNELKMIPEELLDSWTQLECLQLYRNKLTVIPSSIRKCSNLQILSVSGNKLRSLPEEMGDLSKLREIYANNNSTLSSLPETLGNLSELVELSVRGCPKLKSIPASLAQCVKLKHIDLRSEGKKEACKLPPEIIEMFEINQCKVVGGIAKKKSQSKGKKKNAKKK